MKKGRFGMIMFLYGIFMIGVFFLHMIIAVIENVVGIVLVIMGTKKSPLKRKEIPEPLGLSFSF